jgi:outer membrane immunogenic protein
MKKLLLGSVAILAFAVPLAANAADLPAAPAYKAPAYVPAPVYTWTGFYIGLNAGGAWSDQSVNFSGTGGTPPAIAAGQVPASLSLNPTGFIGGGQIGYNYQSGPVVWGLEADWQWASLDKTQTVSTNVGGGLFPVTTSAEQKMDFFGTARGRIGFTPTAPLLLYVTGGLAYADVQLNSSVNTTPGCPGFCGSASTTAFKAGWTAGGGAEWKFAPNWSGKLEYLYYDLGSISQTYTDSLGRFVGTSVSANTKFTGNIVRLGVNYQFTWGGPVVARY